MNIYLEYKDEKSAKFWTIEVNGTDHTVTYGKLGTDGQTKVKSFESAEEATKAAEKLVKAKTKKGYQEVDSSTSSAPKFSFIEEDDAREKFDLDQYEPLGDLEYDAVLLIDGNLVLEKTLEDDSIEELLFDGNKETEEELIIIKGNLTIKGDLDLSGDSGYPSLLVLGDIHCEALLSYDNITNITGDAHLKHLFYGNYNHGVVAIAGITHAPYIINSDHDSDLKPSDEAILINSYSDHDDFFTYHYHSSDLTKVLVKEALYVKGEDIGFDVDIFREFVATGKNPFKEGATPKNKK